MAGTPRGYRTLFADRRFAFYFGTQTAGDAGYAVYAIAVVWLALEVSGSLFVASVVLALEYGIYSLSFTAGPFVDRARNPRTILFIGYPAQGALALVLGTLALTGHLGVPTLLVLVAALSVLWNFTYWATLAILPRIVGQGQLFRAHGLTTAISGVNQIIGYVAGAALILLVGPAGGMFLYAALNFVAALLAIGLVVPRSTRPQEPLAKEFWEGWRYFFSRPDRSLVELSVFSAMEAFFAMASVLLIALLARTEFADPAGSYGLLFTSLAVGGIAGGLLLGHLNPRHRVGILLVGVTAAEGLAIILATSAAPSLVLSALAWFALGFIQVGFFTTVLVYVQATTPGPILGRTMSNVYLFRGSSLAVGALVVGALGLVLPPVSIALVVGAFLLTAAALAAVALPTARRLSF